MTPEKLSRANYLSNLIRNLELVLNDFHVNNCDTFCAYRTTITQNGIHVHTVIKDSTIADEIKSLIREKINKYKKEFEAL